MQPLCVENGDPSCRILCYARHMISLPLSFLSALPLLIAPAAAFESEEADVTLEDRADLFTNIEYSTGIIPGGSPVGVEFHIEANGGATAHMEGSGDLTWPDALTLAFTGEPGTGILRLDGSLAAVTQIMIDLSDYGYEGVFEIDRREISFDGLAFFDPFVMDGAATDRVEIVDTTDSAQLINYSFEIITGLQLTFTADMTPTFTAGFEGVSWVNNEGFATTEGQAMDLEPEPLADYPVDSTFNAAWDANFALVFTPSIQACAVILGCITIAEFEFPIELLTDQFEQAFPTQTINFPLPVFDPDVTLADFGGVEPGSSATYNIPIRNIGNLSLYGDATVDGSGTFSVFPTSFNALPGTEDGVIVTFSPVAAGAQTANLILTSNDPNIPEMVIALQGNGIEEEVDEGQNTEEEEIKASVDTCGCSASDHAPAGGLALLPALLGAGLLVGRRRA